jgi:hypothetical protein
MSITGFNRRRRELAKKREVEEAAKREAEEKAKAQKPDEKSLNQLTVPVLKEKAKELKIEGSDNMKKPDLIAAILKALESIEDAD